MRLRHRLSPLKSPSSTAIRNLIQNASSAAERATLKGREIAKIGSLPKQKRKDYAIEIVSLEPIEGGLQVFARAWDKADKQIGFGSDGTVDIERFRIFNPPVLVPDEHGDIVQEFQESDPTTGAKIAKTRRLREDPQEALLQVIEHAVEVKTQKWSAERIIAGSVGNMTTIVYPDAHPETYTHDASMYGASWSTTWSTARNQASAASSYSSDSSATAAEETATTRTHPSLGYEFSRSQYLFR